MREKYNAAEWLIDRNLTGGNENRIAIISDLGNLTYGEIINNVFRVQNLLVELGVRREERVALILNDEPGFPAWFLGCMRSGVVPVPLSTMLTGVDLGQIVDDALAGVAVLSSEYAYMIPDLRKCASNLRAIVIVGSLESENSSDIILWDDFSDRSPATVAATNADSPAFWLYSSGTTGFPKGVMHRHYNLQSTADTYASSVLRPSRDDRFYSAAKLFFAFGLGNSLTFPFAFGASVILDPNRANPRNVASVIFKHKPSLFFGSPGLLAAILDAGIGPEVFESVRLGVTAGEALPGEVLKRFRNEYGFPVLDGIGSTEALHIFLSNHSGSERPGTSGNPVTGYRLKLLDDRGAEISEPDVPGYLHVSGESVATGYWSRAEATRGAFQGHWLKTGDVYVRSADNYFRFLGRNSDMIKLGGIWVSPAEVEGVLVEHPDILEAAVVGGRDKDGLETAVAFVVARSGRVLDQATVEAHCRSKMAAFKRPRSIFFVSELPKTATGKVQRYQLRDRVKEAAN